MIRLGTRLLLTSTIVALCFSQAHGQAQIDDDQIEVMTRGPVHEAYAAPMTIDPAPGLVAPKEPPAAIEEIPPEQKPAGDVVWISGYWAWDEATSDFIWISGVWRVPPPNQIWVPGYWDAADNGWRWMSGFWTDAQAQQVEYYPDPPASLEEGPSSPAPDESHFWIPGCWRWQDRYVWQAGYWAPFQPGWVWVPSHYQWTPIGCLFIPGHWDYPVVDRGLLFAPVYYRQPIYLRPAYVYTPRVVVNPILFTTHLFAFPRYGHYCFGNYYDPRFQNVGIQPWYAYGGAGRGIGYDPLFSYYRTYNRSRNPNWYQDLRQNYRHYEQFANSRPPSTFRALQQAVRTGGPNVNIQNISVATTLNQFVSSRSNQFQQLDDRRREDFRNVADDLRNQTRQRAQLEARGTDNRGPRQERDARPTRVDLPELAAGQDSAFRRQFARRQSDDPQRRGAADRTADVTQPQPGQTQPGQTPDARPGETRPDRNAEDRLAEERQRLLDRIERDRTPGQAGEPAEQARNAREAERARQLGQQPGDLTQPRTGEAQTPNAADAVERARREAEKARERLRNPNREDAGRQQPPGAAPPAGVPGADDAAERARRLQNEALERGRNRGLPGAPDSQAAPPGQGDRVEALRRQQQQAAEAARRQQDNAGPQLTPGATPPTGVPGADEATERARRLQNEALERSRNRGQSGVPDSQAVPPGQSDRVEALRRQQQQAAEAARRAQQDAEGRRVPGLNPGQERQQDATEALRQQQERTRQRDVNPAQPGQLPSAAEDAVRRQREQALERMRRQGDDAARPNLPGAPDARPTAPTPDNRVEALRRQQQDAAEAARRQQQQAAERARVPGVPPGQDRQGGAAETLRRQQDAAEAARRQQQAAERARAPGIPPGQDRQGGNAADALRQQQERIRQQQQRSNPTERSRNVPGGPQSVEAQRPQRPPQAAPTGPDPQELIRRQAEQARQAAQAREARPERNVPGPALVPPDAGRGNRGGDQGRAAAQQAEAMAKARQAQEEAVRKAQEAQKGKGKGKDE